MNKLNKFFAAVRFAEKAISVVIFIVMFLLFIFQIVTRYFFTPYIWVQEAILACFLWLLIFATCYADQTSENIQFTSFYEKLGEKGKLICDILSAFIVVVSLSVLFPTAVKYIMYSNTLKTHTLPVTYGIVYAPFLYLLISFWCKYLKRLIVGIQKGRNEFRKDSKNI